MVNPEMMDWVFTTVLIAGVLAVFIVIFIFYHLFRSELNDREPNSPVNRDGLNGQKSMELSDSRSKRETLPSLTKDRSLEIFS
jgi:uncharacterized membrane protein